MLQFFVAFGYNNANELDEKTCDFFTALLTVVPYKRMEKLPTNLETERLLLRPLRTEDAPVLFQRWTTDPEVTKYLSWRPHTSLNDTIEYIERCKQGWESGERCVWGVELKPDNGLIGAAAVSFQSRGRAVLGYVFGKSHWGNGYATEALIPIRNAVMARPDIFRFWAFADIENPASGKVLEKLQMEYEGILRRWIVHPNVSPEPRDAKCYSLVRK